MAPDRQKRTSEAFYGRRRGKTLRTGQREALERCLSRLAIDLDKSAPPDLKALFEADVGEVRLEIGFGGGEHLLRQVVGNPAAGFIGVEPFVNGMAKLASAIGEEFPPNLRLYDDDATRLLDWMPAASVAGIDLLYPDPWPKKRHWKRRFVNRANLDRFARVLAPDGVFRFASDIDTYVNWTLLHVRAHPDFFWPAETSADWNLPFEGWPGTRYEAKAIRQGRKPAYLTFRRI